MFRYITLHQCVKEINTEALSLQKGQKQNPKNYYLCRIKTRMNTHG